MAVVMARRREQSCAPLINACTNSRPVVNPDYRERVFKLVRRIPRGRVMTYGQVAAILGEGYTPRTVGFVMHSSDGALPWHRVINAQGACSTGGILLPADKQQKMLEREGVKFDERQRCDLERYLWTPPAKQKSPKTTLFKKRARTARTKT